MKSYRITDVKGDKRDIQASDIRAALIAHELIYQYPEAVKIKLIGDDEYDNG